MSVDPIATTFIGRTTTEVTRLGLGTAAMIWPAPVTAEQAQATILHAWARGIRYFDTAPSYGYGAAETHVGAALAALDRDSFTLSTKVGRLIKPVREDERPTADWPPFKTEMDFSAAGAIQSIRESRERLGFPRIDIGLIHDPDDHDEARLGAYSTLSKLRERAEIPAIGFGMNALQSLTAFVEEVDPDCVLLAGHYTLLDQTALDELIPALSRHGASLIASAVFHGGLLIDGDPSAIYNGRFVTPPSDLVKRAQRLREVCAEFKVPMRAAALQFPLAHPIVASVVIGAQSPQQVDDNLASIDLPIPDTFWIALKELGLIRPDAPVPTTAMA